MQIRGLIGLSNLDSDFRLKASLLLIVSTLCIVLGITTALLPPLLSVGLIVVPAALFLLLRYPEIGLICYATSLGFADLINNLIDIPSGFDTLFVGILVVVALLFFVLRKEGGKLLPMGGVPLTALCMGFVLFLGLLWTPSPEYGRLKVEGYLLLNLLLLFGVSLFSGEVLRLKRMIYSAAFLGVIYCFWGLITILIQQSEGWSQAILLGGFLDPIWLARGLGVFTISLVVLAQITKAPIAKVCMWAVVAVLIFLMFYTGSRGPVFSLLITLLLYFAFLSRRPLWQGILLAFIGGVGLYAIFSAVPFGAQSRFLYFADPTAAAYVDTGARLQFWQRAVGIFRLSPVIGVGTGGYSYHAWGLDIRSYPHNLFLEIACELGILGIASFLAFLFAGIRVAGRISPGSTGVNRQNFPAIWGISIFIFALLNSMVSGDIFSNSLLWLSSGFMWATYVTFEKKKRNLNPENS